MSADNAKDAADNWIAQARLPADADGRHLQLVTFVSDEDCRFFYPRRALSWQLQVNTFIARQLRPRKIRIRRLAITPAEYETWRGARGDTPELRREFADGHLHLLE